MRAGQICSQMEAMVAKKGASIRGPAAFILYPTWLRESANEQTPEEQKDILRRIKRSMEGPA